MLIGNWVTCSRILAMRAETPVGRAVATYRADWSISPIDRPGFARVNPETLSEDTSADFEFRYIDISTVTAGSINWDAVATLRFGEAPSRARRVVRDGDTMICTVRPLLMSHASLSAVGDVSTVCSTGFAVIRSDGCLQPGFLKHLPFAEQVTRQFSAWQCGTNYPAVNERDVHHLMVPVPLPDEQAAIARILDAVDVAMECTREAVERAREVRRALVQRLFTAGLRGERKKKAVVGHVPLSWDVVPVSSVVTNFQYGLSVPMQTKGSLPILRMGNIQDGSVTLSELKYVSLPEKQTAPYLLKPGDVLFNRTNSQEWVGKVGIYRHDAQAVFASYLIRLIPDSAKVNTYYLSHVLASYQSQCRIKRYATPGVQQVNINATNLGKVLIPLPIGPDGLIEQANIAALLEAADARVRSHEPVLIAQQRLKNALIHGLLTGQVRVRDAAAVIAA
jgi:type I restriction enzyme, S subunit